MGKILMLPGDGIGTEVMAEVRRIIDWFGTQRGFDVTIDEDLVGVPESVYDLDFE